MISGGWMGIPAFVTCGAATGGSGARGIYNARNPTIVNGLEGLALSLALGTTLSVVLIIDEGIFMAMLAGAGGSMAKGAITCWARVKSVGGKERMERKGRVHLRRTRRG